MRQEMILTNTDVDVDSRRARATLVNMIYEQDKSGKFSRVRRTEGLKLFATMPKSPIRGLAFFRTILYVAAGDSVYTVDLNKVITEIGQISNTSTLVRFETNGSDTGQIFITSDSIAWVYTPSDDTFVTVSDPNFFVDKSVAVLNERMYTNQVDSNLFRASAVGDALRWPALDFASANDRPDEIRFIVARKSNLVILGARSTEYWQSITAAQGIPVRRVLGATQERGVIAPDSVVVYEDIVFWLADDLTVRILSGNNMSKISDIAIESEMRGDISNNKSGFERPETAEGFFIDGPVHKVYVLNFPFDDQTWCYDLATSTWHRRKSKDIGRWRARTGTRAFDKNLAGDFETGDVYELDFQTTNENGVLQEIEITTPPLTSSKGALFISEMEMIMEVGVGNITDINNTPLTYQSAPLPPEMKIDISKDGGSTWRTHSIVPFGSTGQRQVRVLKRLFGYTKRNFEFLFRFRITEDVPVFIYQVVIDIEQGT